MPLALHPSQTLLQSTISILKALVFTVGQTQGVHASLAYVEAHKALGLIVDPFLVNHSGFAPMQPFGFKQ